MKPHQLERPLADQPPCQITENKKTFIRIETGDRPRVTENDEEHCECRVYSNVYMQPWVFTPLAIND